jgi:hypothetical protein
MFRKSATSCECKATFCVSIAYRVRAEKLPFAKEKQLITSEKLLFASVLQACPSLAREKPLEKLPGS